MTYLARPLTAALLAALALAACKKPEPAAEATADAPAPAAESPAAPAASEPAAPTPEQQAALDKQRAIDRALAEQKYAEDPKGQWASSASASTTYATVIGNDNSDWKAESATGAPDAQDTGEHGHGWAPEKDGAGIEWLELGFAKPVNATELRVRQITAPGAIIKIELIDEAGARHTVWEGRDDSVYESGQIGWLAKTFDRTDYKAKGARLTLATNAVDDRESIDAVQLIGD